MKAVKAKKFKQMTIPVFIPHMGCGHSCTFCNQRTISGQKDQQEVPTEAALRSHIEDWLSTASAEQHIEIGFFGGSFTGIDPEVQEMALSVANSYLKSGQIQGIRLSTRPDYLGKEVITRLLKYGVTLVEMGVQSLDDRVLTMTKRGHTASIVDEAVRALKNAQIGVGLQLMLGLPGDTPELFMNTVRKAIAYEPDCVRLYPTLVLEGTELSLSYRQGFYTPLSLETAVAQAEEAYDLFIQAGIPVIRMGLQASEELSKESNCLAGPHHDAFRDLVEAARYKRLMKRDLELGLIDTKVSVLVNPKHVSFFSGQKRANVNWLLEQGVHIEKIISDEEVPLYEMKWIKNKQG